MHKLYKLIGDNYKKIADLYMEIGASWDILAEDPELAASFKEEPEAKVAVVEVSIEELRSMLASKSKEGKTGEVKALLNKYGAAKLSDLKEEHYEAVLNEGAKL